MTSNEPRGFWTVGQVADEVGVSRRTLHHYDEIGLLTPSQRSYAGYRLYSPDDLRRLRSIALWRRLDMPLEEIRVALASGDPAMQLRRQRDLIAARIVGLQRLLTDVERVLEDEMTDRITPAQLREIFGGDVHEGLAAAEERWGETDAWRQSAGRTATYGPAEWEKIKAETRELSVALVSAYEGGHAPDSPTSVAAVEAHRVHIDRWYYDCDADMHRQLGGLYADDPRYALGCDEVVDPAAYAAWIHDAIEANAGRLTT